jgi:PI-3-kinase-related kinase SMG-1
MASRRARNATPPLISLPPPAPLGPQVAPELASIRSGAIPMPADDLSGAALPPLPLDAALDGAGGDGDGDEDSSAGAAAGAGDAGGWLSIAAVAPHALALPTKTRPKRLRLLASDGSVHAFLLKGRDDLRVDERLMQFMRAANALAGRGAAAGLGSGAGARLAGGGSGGGPALALRQYSVTPLGPRAGLVQWVRGTLSLYALFRQWQAAAAARLAAVAAARRAAEGAPPAGAAGAAGGNEAEAAPPLPLMVAAARPADAFYARLLPALHAAGVPRNAPRKDWPQGAPRLAGSVCRLAISARQPLPSPASLSALF